MIDAPRRLLIDLGNLAGDGGALRTAAELGTLLGLDLVGIFVEDEQLALLAGAREYRLPAGSWGAAEPERILGEIAGLAERARRQLQVEVAALGQAARFERLRGDPAALLVAHAAPRDILATGFAAGADFACRSVAGIHRAAFGCAASVLMLPSRPARVRGTVAVLAPRDARTGLDLAEALARAAGERMLLLTEADNGGPAGVATRRIAQRDAEAIEAALVGQHARLLILPNESGAMAAMAQRLAARLRVPVLLAEPVAAPPGAA
ncbi:hypothetical protein J5Y09_04425 [Roseomonas sp. PWR1]|uniref:Universal stress protein n=1 Tax=Roseomonas nitratireducens TaxID=2820810 RepID=A0ABS4AP69_9PROT|nr:hypothetical protein [Neoroseomonas nitratireducens]MBP0463146.1 hypothetical protein [Neoroseomonas nitratireducens]